VVGTDIGRHDFTHLYPYQAKERLSSAGADLQIIKQESQLLKETIELQEESRNAHQRRYDKTAAILQVTFVAGLRSVGRKEANCDRIAFLRKRKTTLFD
jgi:predicted SprT family Zn-dependent metalloprotease